MKTRWNTPRLEHLQLDRPLIIFDLETTGTDPAADRIVQIALVRFEDTVTPPKRKKPKSFVRLVNPGYPIPSAAAEVHGFNDEDVAAGGLYRMTTKAIEKQRRSVTPSEN